uniref:helix-turn-helix domain-containing protein n=2 Tax=Eubacteriales TaxID=186802 RepID=UPI003A9139CB
LPGLVYTCHEGMSMRLERLQMLREERGWKQSDMARRLWVSQSTYSGYETGKIQVPVDTLLKLADIYDVSMDYLMGRTDER